MIAELQRIAQEVDDYLHESVFISIDLSIHFLLTDIGDLWHSKGNLFLV